MGETLPSTLKGKKHIFVRVDVFVGINLVLYLKSAKEICQVHLFLISELLAIRVLNYIREEE